MLVDFIMSVVHADDACDILLVAAHRRRVLAEPSSAEHTRGRGLIILVRVCVQAQAFRDEPARTLSLLPLDYEKLQCDEKNDKHCCDRVALLVQEILAVEFQVERHE